jgi:beta-phosphoglucomutase family hydrolase
VVEAEGASALGLPPGIKACLFDLDGVLTKTATVHAAAWKEMFDAYLRERADRDGTPFTPFDAGDEYNRYVDGKPRLAGTRDFLTARGIELPEGREDDPPGAETLYGLGNRKNELVLELIKTQGVETYEGSAGYVRAARAAGLRTAVVSSSANTEDVLAVTSLAELFDARIDGVVARERHLPGKPAPDTFRAGAEALGVEPAEAAVFEDAVAGVQAGRAGNFGWVVGVDRVGHADELREGGADVVVRDLAELMDGR